MACFSGRSGLSRALFLAALGVASASSAQAEAASIVRRPYLQSVTRTSAVVVWTTDVATDSLVLYGESPQTLDKTAALAAEATQHEVTITGLEPGQRYFYAVGSISGLLEGKDVAHFFQTAPALGNREKFRAWIVGDSGTGGPRQKAVRDAMLKFVGDERPDMFLHMGDMAYSAGTEVEFTNNFFAPYAEILRSAVVWPTLGNHEGLNSDSATQTGPYYTAYVLPKAGEAGGLPSGTEAYYSFDWGNAHFIVLDSHDTPRQVDAPMLTWMKADLAATNQEWIIAFWHHPAYSKGTHDSDLELQLAEMRTNALPILEAGGVDLVLAGHSHIYERSFLVDGAYDTPTTREGHTVDEGDGKPLGDGAYSKDFGLSGHRGAVYVVAGHGGGAVAGAANHPLMYFSEVNHGSCILDIHENRLSLVNIRWDGDLSDRFALVKGPALVLAEPDGGDALKAGDLVPIRWTTVGTGVPEVRLELSTDDGATFKPIADPILNTGTYTWSVPQIDTRRALVRVVSTKDPSLHDESNGKFSIAASTLSKVIRFDDVWHYNDAGVDLGSDWASSSYDDGTWNSGAGELGFGDGDETTVLTKLSVARPTTYFRKSFHVDGRVTQARVRVLHDDGVAVWINGTPVFSKYMENGTSYNAWASQKSEDNEVSAAFLSLVNDPFVVGENLIAAMVKQSDGLSSDLSFALELELALEGPRAAGAGGAGSGAGGMSAGAGGLLGDPKSGINAGSCGCGVSNPIDASLTISSLGLAGLFWRRKSRRAGR